MLRRKPNPFNGRRQANGGLRPREWSERDDPTVKRPTGADPRERSTLNQAEFENFEAEVTRRLSEFMDSGVDTALAPVHIAAAIAAELSKGK